MDRHVWNARRNWIGRKLKSCCIVVASISLLYLAQQFVVSKSDLVQRLAPSAESSLPYPLFTQIDEVIAATRPSLSPKIESYSAAGEFALAKDELLNRAIEAAGTLDNAGLAFNLGELGELALQQGELGMAEVYLSEALELYEELGDEINVANVHVQIGRLHLYSRKRARQTSDAYDQLLVSRWMISQDQFQKAEGQLKQVVQTNLQLHRYGAAASAYETLYRGYTSSSNVFDAQNAGKEAIKLYATSGNVSAATRILDKMKQSGLSRVDAEEILNQIDSYYQEYEESVRAIGEARDYAQLYNQLSSRGDALQAWRFRRKAEQSLSAVSSRARYRRQPDVLVELYRSNVSMANAIKSLRTADLLYSRYGIAEGVELSRQLREQIY